MKRAQFQQPTLGDAGRAHLGERNRALTYVDGGTQVINSSTSYKNSPPEIIIDTL